MKKHLKAIQESQSGCTLSRKNYLPSQSQDKQKTIDQSRLYNTITECQQHSNSRLFSQDQVAKLQKKLSSNEYYQRNSFKYNRIRQSVGVLRSNWYNQDSNLSIYLYGTAFFIAKNILMTCTHNIFSTSKKIFADQIEFVSNADGQIKKYYSNRKTVPSLKFSTSLKDSIYSIFDLDSRPILKSQVNFQIVPTKYQICIIALGCEDECDGSYLPIGAWNFDFKNPQPLAIFGYPCRSYKLQTNFKDIVVKRQERVGAPYSIETNKIKLNGKEIGERDCIINYKIPTQVGMSGSPILALDKNQNYYVIGIHTHRGCQPHFNSGVLFNHHFIQLIKGFENLIKKKSRASSLCKGIQYINYKDDFDRIVEQDEQQADNAQDVQSGEDEMMSSNNQSPLEPLEDHEYAQLSSMDSALADEQSLDKEQQPLQYDERSCPSDFDGQSVMSNPFTDGSNSSMSDLDGIYEYFSILPSYDQSSLSFCQSVSTFSFNSIYSQALPLLGLISLQRKGLNIEIQRRMVKKVRRQAGMVKRRRGVKRWCCSGRYIIIQKR